MTTIENKELKIETKLIHAGQVLDEVSSRGVPLHRTSAYVFKDTKHAADLFGLKQLGNIYTRLMNPTTDVLEKRLAEIEGGAGALALASGTNAIFYSIINLAKSGDEIVSSSDLYGGSYTMFNNILPDFGIKTIFVDPSDPENFRRAITPKTKAIFTETIGNPVLSVPDFEAISKIAKENKIPYIVDSTFTTPALFNPIEYDIDIICHSLTKWIGGHGTAIGGVVIDSGKFDWAQSTKHPLLTEPDASYHDIRYAHDLGDLNKLAYILRMRLVPLRNLGGCISPDNSWIFLQGLETLHLRMQKHCENAQKVAEFLDKNDQVDWVNYPGLPTHKTHENAKKYLKKGFGGMVVFGIKGGRVAGEKFINNLNLISHVANVGDAKSLAIHPASTTHSQLSTEQLNSGGIKPELIRLSIGIENVNDIIDDINQALVKSGEDR
ncbi:O-acetylhomoserine aminocarboxypropyltransferase/cysteine synthase [archaeon]|jgi:O-acetylhomoserine (thiol)-lyase|nr:O-acetylhomoserine aminocarboxypropyltransferase/cysteine synthase [archaeon]MBT4351726.1 O-acetylhomoserine aminocarboxypropyltransferase/cysteine synthase [archaeon]MBT4646765.1 O-acetylhomoserine aminocarboxypropyltransferase/cysteine synthase [archaeon]MBT6822058.1 O-acetylhomoserine aminocarboxypropyltransferase/cysteine synthase [archaeon]MBT7391444.1 O-acetylhomoserine aminocarboxypropyltransferase/cysteine synthase [archaeon]